MTSDLDRYAAKPWAAPTVLALGLLWPVLLLVLGAWSFGELIGHGLGGSQAAAEGTPTGVKVAVGSLIAAFVLGPAVIAGIAWWGRLRRAAVVFSVVSVVIMVPALLIGTVSARGPAPEPSHGPGGCQEHSGGDTRCPGG